jgi:hypothetical protein
MLLGMRAVLPSRMTVGEFLAWAENRSEGRYDCFPHKGVVVRHTRSRSGDIATTLFHSGPVLLDPPGISVDIGRVLSHGRA